MIINLIFSDKIYFSEKSAFDRFASSCSRQPILQNWSKQTVSDDLQEAMLENLFAKANKYLSQAETLFSRIIPTQICVGFTNPIVQQTQQRVVCCQTGLFLRQLLLLYLKNRRTLKLLWNGSQEVLPSIKHKQIDFCSPRRDLDQLAISRIAH